MTLLTGKSDHRNMITEREDKDQLVVINDLVRLHGMTEKEARLHVDAINKQNKEVL